MERMIDKMARQLNSYDEASLLQMWQRYALKVREFEPTREWEEATLALSLIQAVRWKNQLFNYRLSDLQSSSGPFSGEDDLDLVPFLPRFGGRNTNANEDALKEEAAESRRATILSFPERRKPLPEGEPDDGE